MCTSREVRQVTVTWYDDPADAERDLVAHYRAMSPDERVAETVRLMKLVAGWRDDGRIKGPARIIDVP